MNKIFCFFFVLYIISCSTQQTQQSLPLDGECYTIDLDEKKEASIPLSSLFKSVRTIILETSDDLIIGEIDDLQVFDGYIYILDSRKAKSLFVFNMDGKFVRKIGRRGQGPGDYNQVHDFTLDTENRIIYLCDSYLRVHKYQLDGTYLQTIKIQASGGRACFIQFYNGRLYSNYMGGKTSQDDYMLLEIDPNNGSILSRALPVKDNKGWNELFFSAHSRFFMSRANNPPRYNQMFMDNIMSVGKDIKPYIKLKSKYLTTEQDIEEFRSKVEGLPVNMANVVRSEKIFDVNCFIENDEFINFRIGIIRSMVIILNKNTGEVKLANSLSNDLLYRQGEKGRSGSFVFSDAKGAYVILDTQNVDRLIEFQNAIKNNEIIPDLDKSEQLMLLTEESNPAIFFYEFKP